MSHSIYTAPAALISGEISIQKTMKAYEVNDDLGAQELTNLLLFTIACQLIEVNYQLGTHDPS